MATTSDLSSVLSESSVLMTLIFAVLVVLYLVFLCSGTRKKHSTPQNESQQKMGREYEGLVATLGKVKTELEKQKTEIEEKLEHVEAKREKNKRMLQSVETQIREGREMTEQRELLREKENLLKTEWDYDKMKKIYRSEIWDRDKLLELI
ncbi:golgin subfamily A member 6-like protein 2 [Cheilinus undulatus]|uniref:golgin subfamily A member 6-like protein 2 n=1 Tax=Cheilinus undulatus TaxID=241271 RepID=UPI001BD58020|nr:golgin subfamily A member 6-like protein 2 [Cheilinus undulatus]